MIHYHAFRRCLTPRNFRRRCRPIRMCNVCMIYDPCPSIMRALSSFSGPAGAESVDGFQGDPSGRLQPSVHFNLVFSTILPGQ